ncbi:MAG TPA: hypothetical protein VJ385_07060 [Fibrobacteria bacterium]|nr:hypothetical protein [Fibrobacteria bacterium]
MSRFDADKFNPDISNLFLKALYSVMLTEFSLDSVREFWRSRIPAFKKESIREEDLYRLLWLEGGTLSLDFVFWGRNLIGKQEKSCISIPVRPVYPPLALPVEPGEFALQVEYPIEFRETQQACR